MKERVGNHDPLKIIIKWKLYLKNLGKLTENNKRTKRKHAWSTYRQMKDEWIKIL